VNHVTLTESYVTFHAQCCPIFTNIRISSISAIIQSKIKRIYTMNKNSITMKTKFKTLLIIFVIFIFAFVSAKKVSAQQPVLSFQVFYDQLSPYGQWVDNPDYGYVWLPDTGSDFTPYSTGGHWIITEYGFTWVSDYNWGWAPFHYGRWDYDSYYGWFWIPDNEWGPAWVSWRRADGYFGWEPMGPGISVSLSFGRQYDRDHDHWIFVRERDIDRSDINHYYVNNIDHDRIVRNSSVINNTYTDSRRNTNYASGPAISDVQRATGRRVQVATVVENNRPGQSFRNGRLSMYRPEVDKNNNNERRPVPEKISQRQDVKRPSERNPANQPSVVNIQNNKRAVTQPDNVNQSNGNRSTKAVQQQNSSPVNNSGRRIEQNTVTQPKENSTIKSTEQQQNVKPVQKTRRERQSVNERPPVKKQPVKRQKSKAEQDNKKKD
jgi:hypothetical protein